MIVIHKSLKTVSLITINMPQKYKILKSEIIGLRNIELSFNELKVKI